MQEQVLLLVQVRFLSLLVRQRALRAFLWWLLLALAWSLARQLVLARQLPRRVYVRGLLWLGLDGALAEPRGRKRLLACLYLLVVYLQLR